MSEFLIQAYLFLQESAATNPEQMNTSSSGSAGGRDSDERAQVLNSNSAGQAEAENQTLCCIFAFIAVPGWSSSNSCDMMCEQNSNI